MWYRITRYVPTGSVVLTLTTFASYVLGLLRDRIFAQTFGLSSQLDAYNAAFLLPDFLFNLLVASGIAAAVVPLFSKLKHESRAGAFEYINSVMSASLTVMGVVALLLIIFAGPASYLVAPGLSPEARVLAVHLMRILALSPLLFAVSNALGAMLVADKSFLFYGLSPMLYNLGIIIGVLVLAPNVGIMGAALGTLGGALLHAGVRVWGALRVDWRAQLVAKWNSEAMKKTIKLMLPKMIGHPVELVTFWAFTAIASTLAVGSISALNFARNFESVPVSMIGITMSTAAFPVLADAIAKRRHKEFTKTLWRILSSIFFISALAALVLFIIREPVIRILLGGKSFSAQDIARTSMTLGVFCLAIPTEAMNHLLARAFYARHNTIIPVTFSVVALLLAVGAAWAFAPAFGLLALPAGFAAGSILKALGLITLTYRAKHV